MFLTKLAVRQPVLTTMMMVALLVFGLVSLTRINVDLYPKFEFPVVTVTTVYPGATPDTVETEISRPIEEALNSISGLDKVCSTSYEGQSVVTAQFKLDVDGLSAAQDVRDRVAPLEGGFPEAVEKPIIQRFNPNDTPVLSVALSTTTLSLAELTTIAEQRIVKSLNTVSGVGRAQLIGGQSRQIDIRINEASLRALGVGVNEVVEALKSGNQNLPAGSVIDDLSESLIQVQGRIDQPDDLLDMVVARRGGAPIYLRDVASVTDGAADPDTRAIYNGDTALAIDITKIQDANTVEVTDAVKARLDSMGPEFQRLGIAVEIVTDGSIPVNESVHEVRNTLIEGAALAIIIVFLFLNSWRSTVITALTLPIAIIGTIAVISLLGFTLNMMSLMALTLSIGILIDDAIVVRENITRHLHMGKSHEDAAVDGTNEIGLAVLATTATIVAVFMPVALMSGLVGQFFFQFGMTVSAAVIISLFVSFTLDPMLSSVWYDPDSQPDVKRGFIGRLVARFDALFERMAHAYKHVIAWVLRHRFITLMATVLTFVGSIAMVPMVGAEFVAAADDGRINLTVETPVGSSLDYTTAKLEQVEAALIEFSEVQSVYTTINTGNALGKNKANVIVELVPAEDRDRTPLDLGDPVRDRLSRIAGLRAYILPGGLEGGQSRIQLSVLGEDQQAIEAAAAKLLDGIGQIPGVVDLRSSSEAPTRIISLRMKRDAASDLGIDVLRMGTVLNTLVGGEKVTKWTDRTGETYDVILRLPLAARVDIDTLRDLTISTGKTDDKGAPVMVRLDQVADFVPSTTASEIRRLNRSREVLISADVQGRALGDVTADITALIAKADLPAGLRVDIGGSAKDLEETGAEMITALILAVVLIYMVLASQFASFL